MSIFQNPELRRDVLLYGLLALAAGTAGLWFSPAAGLTGFCTAAGGGVLHFVITWLRYRQLHRLADSLRRVLDGAEDIDFENCTEGELAILRSELHKLLTSLRSQRDTLSAQRLRLSEAMTDISHQLRTPLTAMTLNLSLLKKPDLSPERRRTVLRELVRMTERLDWLCISLLRLAQLDAGTVQFRIQPTDLRPLVLRAAEPLAVAMELRGQSFTLIGEGSALVDENWTMEAVSNLLKNCMEHTPENGRVWVSLSQNPVYTEVLVEDSGPGFAAQDLPHLFERFYRGSASIGQGFGVGLTLARRIITAQNGTIKAENRTGAAFLIRFYHTSC